MSATNLRLPSPSGTCPMTILDHSSVLLDLSCEHNQGTVLSRNLLEEEWKSQPNVSGEGEELGSHQPYSVWACNTSIVKVSREGWKGEVSLVFEVLGSVLGRVFLQLLS